MDFKEAADRLTECITLEDIANAAGVSHGLIRQARLESTASSYRNPPTNWPAVVAKLARKRAAELVRLADAVERAR